MTSNNAVILRKAHALGPIVKGETLTYEKLPYKFNELAAGQIVVQTMYLSADPYLVPTYVIGLINVKRGKIREPDKKSYSPVRCLL
jgi:hypothetical protein